MRIPPCFFIFLVHLSSAFVLSSCSTTPPWKVVTAEGVVSAVEWSAEERAQLLARRDLVSTSEASHHLLLLNGAETPHAHDRHDLTVFMLSGQARLHLAEKNFELKAGDVVRIPKGQVHWAEKTGGKPCEVYAIFTPAFDGKDHREIG